MVVYTAIRGGKNMKKGKMTNYKEVLTSDETVQIGYSLAKYETGKINYKIFEELMNDMGISVNPMFNEINPEKMSYEEVMNLRDRINSKEFKSSDIEYYVMSSKKHPAFEIRHDREKIKSLVEYGESKAKKTRELKPKVKVLKKVS